MCQMMLIFYQGHRSSKKKCLYPMELFENTRLDSVLEVTNKSRVLTLLTHVISWPVVHLMLALSVLCNLKTQQVNYSNTFAQAKIDDDVYIILPDRFKSPIDGNIILKLHKSLYGLQQSPLA